MKMVTDIKRRWLEALRSGDYKQAKSVLRNTEINGFCCLGVLCDVVMREVHGKWVQDGAIAGFEVPPDDECSHKHFYYSDTELPIMVADYTGLDDGLARELMTMNDEGQSFEDISQYIERNA